MLHHGLQNAVITKLSRSEIRTTHITGVVTDIGSELGKLLFRNAARSQAPVQASRQRLLASVPAADDLLVWLRRRVKN